MLLFHVVEPAGGESFLDTFVKVVIPLIAAAATLVVAWFAHNYRRQMKLRLAEQRRVAHSRLYEITGLAAPTRLEAQGLAGHLTPPQRQDLYQAMTDWYYTDGNGMLLTKPTRGLYLNTKHNLVCLPGHLRPCSLAKDLPTEVEDPKQLRGILAIKQLSLLRTQLKADLAIYGQPYVGKLKPHERRFLWASGVDLSSRAWAEAAGRSGLGRIASWFQNEERQWQQEEKACEEAEVPWHEPQKTLQVGEDRLVPNSSTVALAEARGERPRRSKPSAKG